jgi:hypothetical protein
MEKRIKYLFQLSSLVQVRNIVKPTLTLTSDNEMTHLIADRASSFRRGRSSATGETGGQATGITKRICPVWLGEMRMRGGRPSLGGAALSVAKHVWPPQCPLPITELALDLG